MERTTIPRQFWQRLTPEEFTGIIQSGRLNAVQCASVWRMLDRQDAPPKSLALEVKTDDVMRIWKATTPPPR